jgi:DNA polymerase III delta prime subunit
MRIPSSPADFIGTTGQIAHILWQKTEAWLKDPQSTDGLLPVQKCFLFHGTPGVGKSELAKLLANRLAPEPGCLENLNGSSLNIDTVRRWSEARMYIPLCSKFMVKLVDEIDGTPDAACNQMRTYLDYLPRRTIIIATTNKPVEKLQEQYQSRFKQWPFEPIPTLLVKAYLLGLGLSDRTAAEIAQETKGNMRAALADADSALDTIRYSLAA